MTDDLMTICERWERKGFEDGFRIGGVVAGGVALLAAFAGWWLR